MAFLMVAAIPGINSDGAPSASALPTREAGQDLEIVNGTVRFDISTGSREYDTVSIRDNGRLEIVGVTLKAKEFIVKDIYENTSLSITDDDGVPGLLTVQEGIVNVKAGEIVVRNSRISVINGTTTVPNGEDGGSSEIILISLGHDLVLNNSELNVRGHDGGLGETNVFAGKGGDAYLFLGAANGGTLLVSGSEFQAQAGAGGDAYTPNSGAEAGGDANLRFSSRSIDMRNCNIFVKSGKAGAHSPTIQGEEGGNADARIESDLDLVIHSSHVEIVTGANSDGSAQKRSWFLIRSRSGKVLWDHAKIEAEKMATLSRVIADTFQADGKLGTEIHQVDTVNEPPQPFGTGKLELFWWAKVLVKDVYGEPLTNAKVTYLIDPDPLPYPRDSEIKTDQSGRVNLEVVGRENQDYLKYIFQAEIQGNARGNSDQIRFDDNMNRDAIISITRMTLELVSPDINDFIGEEVIFRGIALPGHQDNQMSNVTLYVDEEVIGYATDDSEPGAPPYSLWSLKWDSKTVPDGTHILSIVGTDTFYQVRIDMNIKVNQEAVNHRPTLHSVTISDSTATTTVDPTGKGQVHVSQEESIIDFEVDVFDRDVTSSYLKIGEGIKVVRVTMNFVYTSTGAVILANRIIVEDDIEKVNLTGGFSFSFDLDANKKPGTDDPYPEGEYKVIFSIEDEAGYSSFEEYILFDLSFDFYPKIILFIEAMPVIRPTVDPEEIEDSFKLETENSHTTQVIFNFTESSDRDDTLWSSDPLKDRSWSNLRFTVEIMDQSGKRQVVFGPDARGSGFAHEFDLEGFPENQESIFTIVVTAKDSEDLQSELRLKARILYDPPEVDKGIFGQESFIIYGPIFYIFPALFVLLVGVYLGLFGYVNIKNNKDKKGKMGLLEKKRKEEEKAKGSSAIEDEFVSGLQKDSRKYLEQTGGGKGREEFAKELQAAQNKSELPAQEQETLSPVPLQQPAPPAQQKPAVPQPVQQPPAKDAPPQQAPPQQAPPPQQQPPDRIIPPQPAQGPPAQGIRPPVPGAPAAPTPTPQGHPAPPKVPPGE